MRFLCMLACLLVISLPAMAARPVVVELFTSQGCSSCPPADDLLIKLAQDPAILALSYHVDYWDHLGWKDPYSLADATQRQYAYSQVRGSDQVFTPQAIINGAGSATGSREAQVKTQIETAQRTAASNVDVVIDAHADKLSFTISGDDALGADILLVYFVPNAETDVQRGENKGRKLRGVNIVTRIESFGVVVAGATPHELKAPTGGVAVLVQQKNHGRILGAESFINKPL